MLNLFSLLTAIALHFCQYSGLLLLKNNCSLNVEVETTNESIEILNNFYIFEIHVTIIFLTASEFFQGGGTRSFVFSGFQLSKFERDHETVCETLLSL